MSSQLSSVAVAPALTWTPLPWFSCSRQDARRAWLPTPSRDKPWYILFLMVEQAGGSGDSWDSEGSWDSWDSGVDRGQWGQIGQLGGLGQLGQIGQMGQVGQVGQLGQLVQWGHLGQWGGQESVGADPAHGPPAALLSPCPAGGLQGDVRATQRRGEVRAQSGVQGETGLATPPAG